MNVLTSATLIIFLIIHSENASAMECNSHEQHDLALASRQDVRRHGGIEINWEGASEIASEGESVRVVLGRELVYMSIGLAGAAGIENNEYWVVGRNIYYSKSLKRGLVKTSKTRVAKFFCSVTAADIDADKDLRLINYVVSDAKNKGVEFKVWPSTKNKKMGWR